MKGVIIGLFLMMTAEAALIGCLTVDNARLQQTVDKYAYALSDPR